MAYLRKERKPVVFSHFLQEIAQVKVRISVPGPLRFGAFKTPSFSLLFYEVGGWFSTPLEFAFLRLSGTPLPQTSSPRCNLCPPTLRRSKHPQFKESQPQKGLTIAAIRNLEPAGNGLLMILAGYPVGRARILSPHYRESDLQ
ncbi:hypothetical protein CDAR_56181 [Caerostris darwini]|uniref:Uncharacterized protein n=1 Tax=Caerostris darwini TaxID=1538125 RepID=A0AAV4RSW0_9ARAC|nr:hypothetical protein CDAR_56181 [Caerostris darwini]